MLKPIFRVCFLLAIACLCCYIAKTQVTTKPDTSLPAQQQMASTGNDTIRLHFDSAASAQGKKDVYIMQKKEPDSKFNLGALAILIAIIGLLFTVFTFYRVSQYKRMDFILEVNKMQINEPMLRGIYDDHKKKYDQSLVLQQGGTLTIDGMEKMVIEKKATVIALENTTLEWKHDQQLSTNIVPECMTLAKRLTITAGRNVDIVNEAKVTQECILTGKANVTAVEGTVTLSAANAMIDNNKLRAFCYYKINNFEMIFLGRHVNWNSYRNWELYMIDTLSRSTSFRELIQTEIEPGHSYAESFIKRLKLLRLVAEVLKGEQLTQEAYTKRVKVLKKEKKNIL